METVQDNFELLSSFLAEASNSLSMQAMKKRLKYCRATCPDPQCKITMYFPSHELSVECHGCGQRHSTVNLSDKADLTDGEQFQKNLSEMKLLYGGKKTAELVKVKGISNYQCKLISPLLTTHGKDKNDQPCPLSQLGMGDVFDCSKLASRAFAIEEGLLTTKGYGQDKSGSARYLNDTLSQISKHNDGRKALVPVHADGDGHCLVHAVSRCLIGRELFWHALRLNMKLHLEIHRDEYISLIKDFLSEEEWPEIVAEAAPDYHPPDGQPLGLRTVHIFALANVLHRPIILLDSIAGMQTKGEYSGIFLPALLKPDQCMTNNVLNSPIVIAWSSSGYNHFIPLVPIRDEPLPKLPSSIRPEVWAVNESLINDYIKMEDDGSIIVSRGKPLQDAYLQKLVLCMEQLFFTQHGVVPSLVAEFNQHVYRSAGYVAISPDVVVTETKMAVIDRRLFRCLICTGITCVPEDWLIKDGILYQTAAEEYSLKHEERYTFPRYGITAEYNSTTNKLVPCDVDCFSCKQTARYIDNYGNVKYENGDRTPTPADTRFSKCCGYKHYWDGNEYDNLPEIYPLQLTWKGRQKTIRVHWFQNESDPTLNSNMYEVASKVVAENFPAEFGDERLVQQVVEMLLTATETKSSEQSVHTAHYNTDNTSNSMETDVSSKAVAMGMSATGMKILHKEELGKSDTERKIKKRVEDKIQRKHQIPAGESYTGIKTRRTSPGPSEKVSPPSKISANNNNSNMSSPKPSPPSPSGLPSNTKRIRVTTSDGKTANLTLTNESTFSDLQLLIESELNIPCNYQRLRWGFPPKELVPTDGNTPLTLSHGERISVESTEDITKTATTSTKRSLEFKADSSTSSLTEQLNALISETMSFEHLQAFPHLFRKGGYCYDELLRSHAGNLSDGAHVQFSEMPDIVFKFNKAEERLEVCLGIEHVPVGPPLTKQQLELAKLAASSDDTQTTAESEPAVKWKLNRPGSGSNVKAFSGAGRTLKDTTRHFESVPASSSTDNNNGNIDNLLTRTELLLTLKSKEEELQKQVRALNNQLMEMNSEQNTLDSEQNDIERKLIDLSSELKQVRQKIKELPRL